MSEVSEKKSIKELVVERLAKSGSASTERLITALLDVELDRRHETLLKAVKLLDEAENQVKASSRPDVQTFNADSTPLSSSFSMNALKAMKSAKEKLARLHEAFDKALEKGDFNQLNQLVAQGGQGKAPSSEEVRAGG